MIATIDIPEWIFNDAGFGVMIGGILMVLSGVSGVVGFRIGSGPLVVVAPISFIVGTITLLIGLSMAGVI